VAGRGIAMDQGSDVFCLSFEWFRAYPRTIAARAYTPGRSETDDNFSCFLSFPTGTATVQLSWTAGLSKTRYSVHGDQGAILVDDDAVALHVPDIRARELGSEIRAFVGGKRLGKEQPVGGCRFDDANSRTSLRGTLDEFLDALAAQEWVGREANDALVCVATILAGYESASRRGREVEIPEVGLRPPHRSGCVGGSGTANLPPFQITPAPLAPTSSTARRTLQPAERPSEDRQA
jgi:predicted dehydrogenase